MPSGRGTYDARQALFNRILTITGLPTYHTNFEGRVFKRLWLPEEKEIKLPYACLPVLVPAASLEEDHGPIVGDRWIQPIFIFVPDTISSEGDSEAGDLALKAKDDVVLALMDDWTLGGVVKNTTIAGWSAIGGDDPDEKTGAVRVDVAIQQLLAEEVLGP